MIAGSSLFTKALAAFSRLQADSPSLPTLTCTFACQTRVGVRRCRVQDRQTSGR